MRSDRVLLYDASGWVPQGTSRATQAVLSTAWACGSRAFPGRSIGADSWSEAYALLAEHRRDRGAIRTLHVWGHGRAGRPYLGPRGRVDLQQLADAVGRGLELVWWRSCNVHRDPDFAHAVTRTLGAISVGHCEVISAPYFWSQRAVCGLWPGEEPFWRKVDGVWVNDRGRALPAVSTFRARAPYNHVDAWRVE